MQLAIGDVVRVRNEDLLGTVTGVSNYGTVRVVSVRLGGGTMRYLPSHAIDLIARTSRPMSVGRAVTTLVLFVVGVVAAVLNGQSVQELGGGFGLTFLVGFGTFAAVSSFMDVLRRRRRVRV